MRSRQNTCGECGGKGHNKRTCGKTPPPRKPRRAAAKGTPPAPPGATIAAGTIDGALRALEDTTPVPAPEREPVVEKMTGEEIETWWILTSGKTGKKHMADVARRGYYPRRKQVADWDNADTTQLLDMLEIAVGQGTTPRALKRFLNYFGAEAKKQLADDDRTPEQILLVLAKDNSAVVRKTLADRKHLPRAVMRILASDNDYGVRVALATRSDLPSEELTTMFEERSSRNPPRRERGLQIQASLLVLIAGHKNTPAWVRREIMMSDDQQGAYRAISNPATTAEDIELAWEKHKDDSLGYVCQSIIANSVTPGRVIDEYLNMRVSGEYTNVYHSTTVPAACAHRNAPAGTLDRTIRYLDADPRKMRRYGARVYYNVAGNANTPESTLRWMMSGINGAGVFSPIFVRMARQNLLARGFTVEPEHT